jgi:hypothetical protein
MNRFARSIASLSLALAVPLAAEAFEGTFTASFNQGESATITLKGKKAKVAPPESMAATNGYPCLDFENMKMRLISTKEKTYFELPLAMMEQRTKASPPKVEATGKSEKILGLAAQEFLATDAATGLRARFWVTSEKSTAINFLAGFQRQGEHGLLVARTARILLAEQGLFPLRISAADKNGKDLFRWEVTALNVATVPPSVFEVPEGYKKISMMAGASQEKKAGN